MLFWTLVVIIQQASFSIVWTEIYTEFVEYDIFKIVGRTIGDFIPTTSSCSIYIFKTFE